MSVKLTFPNQRLKGTFYDVAVTSLQAHDKPGYMTGLGYPAISRYSKNVKRECQLRLFLKKI